MNAGKILKGIAVLAASAAPGVVASPVSAQETPPPCTKVASLSGSDSNPGTSDRPYRSAQKLADALSAGQTGCLRGGIYSTQPEVTMARSGSPGAPITLRSYPGERATIHARFRVRDSANWVVVRDLDLDGSNSPGCSSGSTCSVLPSPSVYGDDVVFENNRVTNAHKGICFLLGSDSYGRAQRTTISGNRIHDCGRVESNYDHGIYMSAADDARIIGNTVYDNASRGIKISPDSQRSVVRGNILDGNGVALSFGGLGDVASNDAVVEGNIMSNSKLRWNVEGYFPDRVGRNNVARRNCLWATHSRDYYNTNGGVENDGGFEAYSNRREEPRYVDAPGDDFRLRSNSPCQGVGAHTFATEDPPVMEAPRRDRSEPVTLAELTAYGCGTRADRQEMRARSGRRLRLAARRARPGARRVLLQTLAKYDRRAPRAVTPRSVIERENHAYTRARMRQRARLLPQGCVARLVVSPTR